MTETLVQAAVQPTIQPTQQLPHLVTSLPGPKAAALIARDEAVLSPSYTRS